MAVYRMLQAFSGIAVALWKCLATETLTVVQVMSCSPHSPDLHEFVILNFTRQLHKLPPDNSFHHVIYRMQ
jgi:hypothetical protein